MIEINLEPINAVIQVYEPSKKLLILEGMRKVMPASGCPVLEIEPTNASNEWAVTRAQRPRYNFDCTLTVMNSNEDYGVEYISTVATSIIQVITDPANLQLRVINEARWAPEYGLCATYIMDSLIENVTYNANKDGTIRTASFDWFALIHEPFPDSHFQLFSVPDPSPVPVRPISVTVPPGA